jgi:hypothetical protein
MTAIEKYWNTPEFKAYDEQYRRNQRTEIAYRSHTATRDEWLAGCAEAKRLLDICRTLPEHLAAFGWWNSPTAPDPFAQHSPCEPAGHSVQLITREIGPDTETNTATMVPFNARLNDLAEDPFREHSPCYQGESAEAEIERKAGR